MEHGKKNRKFGRETKQRKALLQGLAHSLILNGRITTTEAKAKSLRINIEKFITKSKNESLAVKRDLISNLGQVATNKLVRDITPRFKDRSGGYTRIRKLNPRLSDGSPMAIIEFVA